MKFVATDGSVFTNRSKYRKYEMETQYTFRNKQSANLTKTLGSVDGQPFNIINCTNCTIQIIDHCDQVQIDDTNQSNVFIGASSESIFIRDCKKCVFTVACKQLRTRDCEDCVFFLYCKTEPIIESSSRMKFGCFVRKDHEAAMLAAGLNGDNLWYKVYDFNDEEKTGRNWSILPTKEQDKHAGALVEAESPFPLCRQNSALVSYPNVSSTRQTIGTDPEKYYDVLKGEFTALTTLNNKNHADYEENDIATSFFKEQVPTGSTSAFAEKKSFLSESQSREPSFALGVGWFVGILVKMKLKVDGIFLTMKDWLSNSIKVGEEDTKKQRRMDDMD